MATTLDTLHGSLMRLRYSAELLLEKRLWLYLAADGFILFLGLFNMLGEGGEDSDFFIQMVLMPYLLVGLPTFSGVLALERRAGSLDLALAVPSTERYFLGRLVPLCMFFALQSVILLLLWVEDSGNLLRSMTQSVLVILLLAAISLFWAVRLQTGGAVLVASILSVGLLSKWVFHSPMIDRFGGIPAKFLGVPVPLLEWAWNALVLALATFILFQYARARLRRPETMLD